MKRFIVGLSPIIIALIFMYLLLEDRKPTLPVRAAPAVQVVAPTTTPFPTRQIIMNQATATAVAPTPYPTWTPTPAPTLIPDSYAPGGENDAVFSLWFGRIMAVIVFAVIVWLFYLFYQIKMYEIEKRAEVQKAEIEAMTKLKINPRPILTTNVVHDSSGEKIKLSNGHEIDKELVIEFVRAQFNTENDERGLAVSKWKNSNGWTQQDIEAILDHLAKAAMITERQSGKSCSWLTVPDKAILCRQVFRISPFELDE